jgi:membrane protease YdiL (CAAX protease family)
MKIEKISSRVLLACILLVIVCFAAFLGVGYDNPVFIGSETYNQPLLTDVIMWLMYGLTFVTAVLVIWSVVRGAQSNKGNDPAAYTGVPGGKITMFTIGLAIVSLVVGWVCGLGETDFTTTSGDVTTAGWVTVVDVFMISMAILFLAAAIAVGVCMTGIATKSASK